jgi:hypothetical protein
VPKLETKLSKINALLLPVHDTIRSDQLTDETGSIMSPKRRTSGKMPNPHFSGTATYCVASVRQRKIFNFFEDSGALRACPEHRRMGQTKIVHILAKTWSDANGPGF